QAAKLQSSHREIGRLPSAPDMPPDMPPGGIEIRVRPQPLRIARSMRPAAAPPGRRFPGDKAPCGR
ncbi:MAG TPA: hypothetical protein PLR41_10520, partial [Alphaproteobacteria bacterium]|nr:hypothetical protein [Alphaproteobacteria bacterium]